MDQLTPSPTLQTSGSDIQQLNLSGESLALRLRKLQLKQARLSLLQKFGLLTYLPHKKQDAFHAAGAFRRRMVRAGNRFGKSLMGCAEDIAWAMGHRIWYPEGDVRRTVGIPQRPTKGLIITTDFDVVDEVWTSQRRTPPGKIWQLMPADFVKRAERNHGGVIDHVFCQNGSSITWNTVKSWQNDPQSLESVDWDWIHIDEPCPEDMWKAASRGLIDRDGFAWFTLTPLREVWINDMFFPRRHKDSPDKAIVQGSKWAIQGATYDNPYLSKAAIEEYSESLTNDEKQCRLYGLPLDLSGIVYKEFDWDRHVLKELPLGWTAFNKPPTNYTLYLGIDPHPQTPHAVLFCAVSPLGQRFFFNEIFEHCTIRELARAIQDRYAGYYVARILCDPLAYINDPITGTNIADEFAANGVFVEKATKDLSTGILRVKEELKKDNNYYFSPNLDETLWEFERYVWDEKENKPVDANDHMMENLYRLTLLNPRWLDREKITNVAVEDVEVTKPDYNLEDV